MPEPSLITRRMLKAAVRRAVHDACAWYRDLADSYPVGSEDAEWFTTLAARIERIETMTSRQLDALPVDLAFAALQGAEDWERWLYDANVHCDRTVARKALASANRYREIRWATLGRSRLEAVIAEADSVDVWSLARGAGSGLMVDGAVGETS